MPRCSDALADHALLGADLSSGFGNFTLKAQSVNEQGVPYMCFRPPSGEEDEYPDLSDRINGISEVRFVRVRERDLEGVWGGGGEGGGG